VLTPRVVCVGALAFVLTAAHASPLVGRGWEYAFPYVVLLGAAAFLFALNLLHVIVCADAVPDEDVRALARWVSAADDPPGTAGLRVPRITAIAVLVATALIAVVVFERVPHIPDEGAYLIQARSFAAGELAAPAPPVPEAFADYLLDFQGGRWFATTNPGWAAVLALGVLAGAPWLVNPLLGALAILLMFTLVRRAGDNRRANVTIFLLATSPWFLFLAGSQMTHLVTLVPVLAAAVLLTRPQSRLPAVAAALAGLLMGFTVLVRPLDGLLAGTFAGICLLAAARPFWRTVVPYAVGCIGGAIWLLPFNAYFTGHPLRDPMNAYTDRLWYPGVNALGFGADVGNVPGNWGGLDPLPGHGLADVVLNANQNLYNLNFELFGWATGSLVLLLVHLVWGRKTRVDRWAAAFATTVALGYSVYWFSGGPDFGPRYWFLVLPSCLWLSVRGVETLTTWFSERGDVTNAAGRVMCAVVLLAGISVATFVPWRIASKYVSYRGLHGDYLHLQEDGAFGRALVLVHATDDADARSATFLNDPLLPDDDPVFVRDQGPEMEARLREAFADRPVVHVLGRSMTGTHARIVQERP
jgi:hypothetical protein